MDIIGKILQQNNLYRLSTLSWSTITIDTLLEKVALILIISKKQSVLLEIIKQNVGEMSIEETEETLTNPDNRILKQITVEDIVSTDQLFEDLMGTGITARKQFIRDHSKEATYDI